MCDAFEGDLKYLTTYASSSSGPFLCNYVHACFRILYSIHSASVQLEKKSALRSYYFPCLLTDAGILSELSPTTRLWYRF